MAPLGGEAGAGLPPENQLLQCRPLILLHHHHHHHQHHRPSSTMEQGFVEDGHGQLSTPLLHGSRRWGERIWGRDVLHLSHVGFPQCQGSDTAPGDGLTLLAGSAVSPGVHHSIPQHQQLQETDSPVPRDSEGEDGGARGGGEERLRASSIPTPLGSGLAAGGESPSPDAPCSAPPSRALRLGCWQSLGEKTSPKPSG